MSNLPYTYEQLDFLRRLNEIDLRRAVVEFDMTALELDMAEHKLDCELEAEIDALEEDEPIPYSPTVEDASFYKDGHFSTLWREGPFTIYIP